MASPSFAFERAALRRGHVVCGIDEAGRGPWAGPVVAAAVIFDRKRIPKGLNDLKKLSEASREELFCEITNVAQIGVGIVSVQMIDGVNILQATFAAMCSAVENLGTSPTLALVDGNRAPNLPCPVRTIVSGDARSVSIAAASIIAKVTRDRLMVELDKVFPVYGFASHKGYGTPAHAAALAEHGACEAHRVSFSPIRSILSSRR